MSAPNPIRWFSRNLAHMVRNLATFLRHRELGYVQFRLEGSLLERRDPHPPLPFPFDRLPFFPVRASLENLRAAFAAVKLDRRVRGVMLRVGNLVADPATIQALREMIQDLRAHNKRVVCWLPHVDTWLIYLASACDQVVMPESGVVFAPGIRLETVFLKETLALAGIAADFEALHEYKTGPDAFVRSEISEPHRQMLEAILSSLFMQVTEGIAAGRGLTVAGVQTLIDRMPLSADEAVAAGLVDLTLYEDELSPHLSREGRPVSIVDWQEARRRLRQPIRWRRRPAIGVVSVMGTIVLGQSRQLPPLPIPLPLAEQQAGSETVIQTLRGAEQDRQIAAVILHVDSPGGSALASDLIWREVHRLRERKPVVVLMGNRAASGGYYIAVPANCIVAQPATLTGSIGIWSGKFVTAGLLERLQVGREVVQRGARAGLWSDAAPFDEEERQAVRESLRISYERFKARVAEGRGMDSTQVETVARGRIWTGHQAVEQGLIDELGGFETALWQAKRLAGLDPERRLPVVTLTASRVFQTPVSFPTQESLLLAVADALMALSRERVWALPPWMLRITG